MKCVWFFCEFKPSKNTKNKLLKRPSEKFEVQGGSRRPFQRV